MTKNLQFQFPGQPKPDEKPARKIIGEHACEICGAPAHHGYEVSYLRNKPGRWRCYQHRIENEQRTA